MDYFGIALCVIFVVRLVYGQENQMRVLQEEVWMYFVTIWILGVLSISQRNLHGSGAAFYHVRGKLKPKVSLHSRLIGAIHGRVLSVSSRGHAFSLETLVSHFLLDNLSYGDWYPSQKFDPFHCFQCNSVNVLLYV